MIRRTKSINEMELYENTQIFKVKIEDIDLDDNGTPIVLNELFQYFLKDNERMKTEGIFRKSYFAEDEKTLELHLRKYNFSFIEE